MKYYSEQLGTVYDSEKECLDAELKAREEAARQKELKEKAELKLKAEREQRTAERKAAAANVEKARKTMQEAQTAYKKALEDFCQKYGTYHFSSNSVEDFPTLFDMFWPFN